MKRKQSEPVNRRLFLELSGLSIFGLTVTEWLGSNTVMAGEAAGRALEPLNRFPRMVQEYFTQRVRRAERRSLQTKAALQTRADAEAYVQSIQEKIRQSFGPFPEKTPLNPRVTGVVERDTYTIEKIIFESRPKFYVTANLYLPKGRTFPVPGVVGTCGHSANGKAYESYQSFAQGLARMGYAVLLYDPISQGERLQYPNDDLQSKLSPGVLEHLHGGNQQYLVGEFFGAWRAWDGVRALDYLLTREEVDPKHIGVTGNSGGGTMTTWLCGVERRWTMAAPSCFVITFRRNMENELPADTEQCPPKVLALGLDHDDFLAAMAPKPVIILAKEKDYFDARGVEETYERLRRLYRLLGAEENIQLFIGPSYHGYTQENREAMYRWFNRATGVSDVQSEPEITIEEDETLWCTPKGQVCELDSRTIFSFTKEKAETLANTRSTLRGAALRDAVTETLKLTPNRGIPEYRILRPSRSRRYPKPNSATYAVNTERGIHALVTLLTEESHYSRPPKGAKRAILYIAHHSSDRELREEPLIREIIGAEPESAFYACDVRGIGESIPNTCGSDYLQPYGCDYFYAAHSLMLDDPYVGQKTRDALRVLDWLKGVGHAEVHIIGRGWGALPAAFTSLLSDLVTQVTLKNALTSYTEIAVTEFYKWPLSALIPNVLEKFDMPDVYRELEKKKLKQIEPWGAVPAVG